MRSKIIGGILLVFILGFHAHAQEEWNERSYTKEFIWGITKSSNSGLIGGLVFKRANIIGDNVYQSFGLDLVNVKHPKETKRYLQSGEGIVLGKQNYLYTIRPWYGREYVLFKKAPQQGVQINFIGGAGLSFGIVRPYYIEYQLNSQEREIAPFDPNRHQNLNAIVSKGGILKGFFESDVKVGLNMKASLSFEFGAYRGNVAGVELGTLFDYYGDEIEMMYYSDNFSFFPVAFITLYYGSHH